LAKIPVPCFKNIFPVEAGQIMIHQPSILHINPAAMWDGKNRYLRQTATVGSNFGTEVNKK